MASFSFQGIAYLLTFQGEQLTPPCSTMFLCFLGEKHVALVELSFLCTTKMKYPKFLAENFFGPTS